MKRLRPVLVALAFLGLPLVLIATQIARDRAHQLPLGNGTMGMRTP